MKNTEDINNITRLFCQQSTIFSTECIQAINIIDSFDLNQFINYEQDLLKNSQNSQNNNNIDIEMSIENIITQSQKLQIDNVETTSYDNNEINKKFQNDFINNNNIESVNTVMFNDNNSIESFNSLYNVSDDELKKQQNDNSKTIKNINNTTHNLLISNNNVEKIDSSFNNEEIKNPEKLSKTNKLLKKNSNVNFQQKSNNNLKSNSNNQELLNELTTLSNDNIEPDSNFDEETINILELRTEKFEFEKKLYSKLYFLINKCAFCYYVDNKNQNYKNHNSTTCRIYQRFLKQIRNFEIITRRNFNNDRKEKFQSICSKCFMPLTICFRFRRNLNQTFNSSKRLNICFLKREIFCYLYLIFHYQQSLLSLQFSIFTNYKETLLKYADFLSNKYIYYHLNASESTKLIETIQLL